jgi:hypothetical protein
MGPQPAALFYLQQQNSCNSIRQQYYAAKSL